MPEVITAAAVRIFFSKRNNAKYISHLDLYRAMSRALKRADLPVWITEGFNPHIYMTFASPLALGIEGVNEPMDFRLTEPLDFDEITRRLDAVMPAGLRVNRASPPVHKAAEIAKARYEVKYIDVLRIKEFLSRDSIIIEKKGKSLDVKPHIEYEFAEGVLTLCLPAGDSFSLNPWQVFGGIEIGGVTRTAILLDSGEEFI